MVDALLNDDDGKPRRNLNPARIMVLGFLFIVLLGAILLFLPISSRDGVHVSFLTSLFTSVSATCVTGLAAVDTAQTWSLRRGDKTRGRFYRLIYTTRGSIAFLREI